jgi:hypothetical protein
MKNEGKDKKPEGTLLGVNDREGFCFFQSCSPKTEVFLLTDSPLF